MRSRERDVAEIRRLLKYANYQKVADAIGVKRASVSEWARGNDVSPYRVDQVRELMRSVVGRQTKEAAPGVPERLNKIEMYLRAIARAAKVPPAELEKIEEAHRIAQGIAPGRRRSGATRP